MSLKDLVSLSGVPGLEPAITALFDLYKSVENIKVYKDQCKKMHSRCIQMLLTLRDSHDHMLDQAYQDAVYEADANVERIAKKLSTWSTWGKAKSLMNQSEIRNGLTELDRDLTDCVARLDVVAHGVGIRLQNHTRRVIEGNQAHVNDKLERILSSTQDIHHILSQPDTNIRDHMLRIQQAIHDDVAAPEMLQSLQERLLKIHRKSELLPPMIDLTGEVRRIGDHPVVSSGGYSDVFLGEWLGEEKVALKLIRGLNHTQKAQKRFKNEVGIWRQLQHRNVARLYGVASLDNHVYAVSPWMDNRDALTFVTTNVHADRLKILCEVATGLAFLHGHGVVHGDLRAANILISDGGVACITDFGLSVVIEEEVAGDPSSSSTIDNAGNCRWMAPELIQPELIGLRVVKPNVHTDVWSYAMFCLEILTGQRPFHNRSNAPAVISDLITGVRPTRPPEDATHRGLSDSLWELMQRCWHQRPQSRPSMNDVLPRMRNFQAEWARVSLSNRRSSPISIPASSGVIPSESPVSITPPSGGRLSGATPSSPVPSSRTRPSTADSSASGGSSLFPTSPRITRPRISAPRFPKPPKPPPPDTSILSNHPKSASLDVTPPHKGRRATSPRPATADAAKSNLAAPSLPLIGEIYHDIAGEDIDHLIPYLQAASNDTVTIPTVQLQRAASPEPGVASSLPNSFVVPVKHTWSGPALDVAPSEGSSSFSFSSEHSPTSSAHDDASMERPVYIKFKADGTVEAATLPGLVERLIIDSKDFRNDMQFRETFLNSYQAFSEAKEVLDLLIERFGAVSSPIYAEQHAGVRASVRYSVVTVLELWLRGHHIAPKDLPLLYQMREFAISVKSSSPAPTLGASVQRLMDLIDNIVDKVLASDSPLSPASSLSSLRSTIRPSEISPESLAVALTVFEGDRYRKIIPSDCIGWLKGIHESNGISTFMATNDKISHWVQKTILKPDLQSQRSENLAYFLGVAQACQKMRNFSSACALFTGLTSPRITGLKRTAPHDKLGKIFLEAETFVSLRDNYAAYRKALNESKDPCVPWFRVHLHDLEAIHDSHRTFIKQDGYTQVINFNTYYRIHERVRHILSYQDFPHKLEDNLPHAEIQSFVESQLRNLVVDDDFRGWLDKRATELGRVEQVDFNTFKQERVAIGAIRK